MKFGDFQPGEQELWNRRLGIAPDANIETLTEAMFAAEAAGTLFRNDADDRPVGDEYDDHFGERTHRQSVAGARARRPQVGLPQGGPARRPRGRVTFGGSGASMIER